MQDAVYRLSRSPLPRTPVNSVGCLQGAQGNEDVPTMEVISRRWLP